MTYTTYAAWNLNNGFIGFFTYLNTQSHQLLGLTIVILATLAVYHLAKPEPTREAATAASFVGMIVSVLLAVLGIADARVMGAMIVLFLGAIALLINRT